MSWTLLLGFACLTNEPVSVSEKTAQSKPLEVQLGSPPKPIAEAVSQEELLAHVPCMVDFTFEQNQQLTAALNLSTPPCEPCLNKMSYAECMVNENKCSITSFHLKLMCARASENASYDEILELFRFQDIWFDFDGSHLSQKSIIIVSNHQTQVLEYLQEMKSVFQTNDFKILLLDDTTNTFYNLSDESLNFNFDDLTDPSINADWPIATAPWMMSSKAAISLLEHRSYPTIYVSGYRLRGMQSKENLKYLMDSAEALVLQ